MASIPKYTPQFVSEFRRALTDLSQVDNQFRRRVRELVRELVGRGPRPAEVRDCSACHRIMIPRPLWYAVPQEVRDSIRSVACGAGTHGRCVAHTAAGVGVRRQGVPNVMSPSELLRVRNMLGITA